MLSNSAYQHLNLADTLQPHISTSKPCRLQMLSNPAYQHPNLADALQPRISTSKPCRCPSTLHINIWTRHMLANPTYQHPNLADALQTSILISKLGGCSLTPNINIQTSDQMLFNPAYQHPNLAYVLQRAGEFRQPWATTISPSIPPHLTLLGKTTFLNGILRVFKVWFSKIQPRHAEKHNSNHFFNYT